MKPITKLVLGIMSGLIVIGSIVLWDLVIRPNIESEEVVVVKPGVVIHKYDLIKQEQLIISKRNRETLIEGYLKPHEMKEIVGLQASQKLVGNQLISTRFIDFENSEPNPEEGEAIRPIPNQWIYALPATLRRQDSIDIYLVQGEKWKEKNPNLQTASTNTGLVGLSPEQEIANKETENKAALEDKKYAEERAKIAANSKFQGNILLGEEQDVLDFEADRLQWLEKKGLNEEQWNQLATKGDIPVLVDIPVAYAKDGTGNEIQNNASQEKEKEVGNPRLSSTGTITNLEVLLNEEHHRLLMAYINEGYQLYITYN